MVAGMQEARVRRTEGERGVSTTKERLHTAPVGTKTKSPEVKAAERARMLRHRISGGGKPVSAAEQRIRMDLVERAYVNAAMCETIVVRLFKAGVPREDGTKLRMGFSTVRRYVKLVQARWEARDRASTAATREGFRQYVAQVLSTARARQRRVPAKVKTRRKDENGTEWEEAYEDVQDPDHNAINGYLDKLARIDGLYAPDRHLVQAAGPAAFFPGWTEEQIRRYAETGEEPEVDGSTAGE